MKKFLISLIVSLLFVSAAQARSTGCKEGNCENGYGKWVYTDKTTYEGEWVETKKDEIIIKIRINKPPICFTNSGNSLILSK